MKKMSIKEYLNEKIPNMLESVLIDLNSSKNGNTKVEYEKTDDSIYMKYKYILSGYDESSCEEMELSDVVECVFTVYDDSYIEMKTRVLLEGKYKDTSVKYLDYTNIGNISNTRIIYERIMMSRLSNICKLNVTLRSLFILYE